MGLDLTLLLDTATVIWSMFTRERLSPTARASIDADDELIVSAASAWEIATKYRIGRLAGVVRLVEDWDGQLYRFGMRPLVISHGHALRAGSYDVAHADPFDRIIAAQAELDDLTLLASDRAFDLFPVRRLW